MARHQTGAFLALTFGISWPLWLASGTLGRAVIRQPDLHWLLAQIGVFAPAFAGMVVAACVEPGAGRVTRRTLLAIYLPAALIGLLIATRGYGSFTAIGPFWTLALTVLGAWILTWFGHGRNRLAAWPRKPSTPGTVALWTMGSAVVSAGAFLLAWLIASPSPMTAASEMPVPFIREATPVGLLGAVAFNLSYGGSLGEELGWRGVWLPRLLRERGGGMASLVIGFWWALWHAPIDLGQGFGLAGAGALLIRLLWTMPVALLFTWVTIRGGGSLLPALALHTALNSMPDFLLVDPARYQRATGLFWVLCLVAAVAVALTDKRLADVPPGAMAGEGGRA